MKTIFNKTVLIALVAALDAVEQATKDAYPLYESVKDIINSHQGFNSKGKATDIEKAKETVKAIGGTVGHCMRRSKPFAKKIHALGETLHLCLKVGKTLIVSL
jgi:hypothetical protein